MSLFGPSGSGKSTLTSLLAGLRRPTRGQVLIGDDDLTDDVRACAAAASAAGSSASCCRTPSRSLLPYGTAVDNIEFARRALPRAARRQLTKPVELLRQLGLAELAEQRVARMSGGEQQRLSPPSRWRPRPQLLLADEPTSQLDGPNRDLVVELFDRVGAEFGTTMVVVTHDPRGRRRLAAPDQPLRRTCRGRWPPARVTLPGPGMSPGRHAAPDPEGSFFAVEPGDPTGSDT